MSNRLFAVAALTGALAWASTAPGLAQATHTWVSGAGNDSNTGTFTAPYQTLQVAVNNTAPGGLISVVGGGDLGPATISKSVTIDGTGSSATISSATDPIVVQAPAQVTLRHLTIQGISAQNGISSTGNLVVDDCDISGVAIGINSLEGNLDVRNTTIVGPGTDGIQLLLPGGTGKVASVDGCRITGFNFGIYSAFTGHLAVKDTTIRGNGGTSGIVVTNGLPSTGVGTATLQSVTILGAGTALQTDSQSVVDVVDSTLSDNTFDGLFAAGQSKINAKDDVISRNGTGVQSVAGSTIDLVDVDVYDNTVGLSTTAPGFTGAGSVLTAFNNHRGGNTTPGKPNGSVGVF